MRFDTKRFVARFATVLLIAVLASTCLAAQERDDSVALRGLDEVARLLEVIRGNYLEDVEPGVLIEAAIRGMLSQLDPHSNYFPPSQLRQLMMEQEGEYFGVGLTVGIRNNEMTVISPMEGGPASRQGIRTGDLITAIDGEQTTGLDLDINARKLRGPEGTEVIVTIMREGMPEPFDVVIKREKISLKTVPYALMINDQVGYVRLTRFSRTSGDEVKEAVAQLKKEGMTGLVFDLRGNPGGDLDQAVAVANCFLNEGLILYTQGAVEASRVDYEADTGKSCWQGPIVVLINRGSASASEIVAGAMQDLDRALLVGENSWGKGLVQTVLPLSHGAALALTTARYYTPSGRLIQRSYTPGSFDEYYAPDANGREEPMQMARTSLGRVVYGGNGLQPDEVVEEEELTTLSQQIFLSGVIFDYVTHYLGEHPDTNEGFRAGAEVIEDFRSFVQARDVDFDEGQWEKDKDFLTSRITLEVVSRIAGNEAGFRAFLPVDSQVRRAVELMDEAAELLRRKAQAKGE